MHLAFIKRPASSRIVNVSSSFVAGLALAVLAGGPIAAGAALVPAASRSVSCNSNNPANTIDGSSSCALQGATAGVSLSPTLSLFANVSDEPGVASQDAFATAHIFFAVTGGTSGDLVPLNLFVNLTTFADFSNYAIARAYTDGSGAQAASLMLCTDGSCPDGDSFDDALHFTAASGAIRELTLFVGAEEAFGTGGQPYASSTGVCIAPVAEGPYRVAVSGNAAPCASAVVGAVPEPMTWSLIGIGMIGVLTRRRR